MDHGDPKSGDWVLFANTDGWLDIRRWDEAKGWVIFQLPRQYGWLPIGYWRPAETIPERKSILRCLDGRWMPYPIAPPKKPEPPVNPLAAVSDADLIAELQRRIGAK